MADVEGAVSRSCLHVRNLVLSKNIFSNDQALHVLSYYHANGDKCALSFLPFARRVDLAAHRNAPLVEHEFQEIKTALERDAEIAQQNGWLSLVKTPGNRRRLRIIIALACFSQWSGNGLMYV